MATWIKPSIATVQASRLRPATVSAQVRTRGSAWMAIRQRILARDCGLCQVCARDGRLSLARDVDHVRELSDGGTDADGNLQSICGPCHRNKSNASQRDRCGRV